MQSAAATWDSFVSASEEEQDAFTLQWYGAMQSLSGIQVHRQIPVALGSGNKSMEVLASALARKFKWESPGDVHTIFPRIVGLCADLGEIALADTMVQLQEVAPSWLHAGCFLRNPLESQNMFWSYSGPCNQRSD